MDKPLSSSELDIVRIHLSSVLVKPSDRITLADTYNALKDKLPGAVENVFVSQLNKAIKENKFPGMTIVRGRYGGIRLDKGPKPEEPKQDSYSPFARPDDGLQKVSEADMEYLSGEPVSLSIKVPVEIETKEQLEKESSEWCEDNAELYNEMKDIIETTTPVVVVPKVKTTWGASPPPAKKDLWMNGRHYQIPHTTNEIKTLLEKVLEVKEDPEGQIKFDEQTYSCSELAMEFFDKFLFFFYGASLVIE